MTNASKTHAWTAVAFILGSGLMVACSSEPPAAADSGITFTRPDSAAEPTDGSVMDGAAADGDAGAPGVVSVGQTCALDSECPPGAPVCMNDDLFRDGHCTAFCMSDGIDTCPEGSHCTPYGFMTELCLADCDLREERPCRLGYGCGEAAPAAPVCAPGCDVAEDCPAGMGCDRAAGRLNAGRCYDPEAAIADPCEEPEDCNTDSWCIREIDRGWPGGACTVFDCDEEADTGCTGDAHCVFHFYRDPVCVDGCAVDSDCRPGYACLPDETYPDRLVCMPACADDSVCLVPGASCDPETRRCEV